MLRRGDIGATAVGAIIPANTVAPSLAGTVSIGNSLTITAGTWTGIPTPVLTYTLYRDGVAVGTQTGKTLSQANAYVLVAADIGPVLKWRETATNVVATVAADTNTKTYDLLADQTNETLWLEGDAGVTSASGLVSAWLSQAADATSFAQATGSLKPATDTLGGRAAVKGDGVDDFLDTSVTLDNFFGTSSFYWAMSLRLDSTPVATNSGTDVWEAPGVLADGSGFLGVFVYKSGTDTKIAAFFTGQAANHVATYSGVLTVGATYYVECYLSGGVFSIQVNAAAADTVSTADTVNAGYTAGHIRVLRGNRLEAAGVTLGDVLVCQDKPTSTRLANARALFSYRRGVTTP